jgi:hypothetical protein
MGKNRGGSGAGGGRAAPAGGAARAAAPAAAEPAAAADAMDASGAGAAGPSNAPGDQHTSADYYADSYAHFGARLRFARAAALTHNDVGYGSRHAACAAALTRRVCAWPRQAFTRRC